MQKNQIVEKAFRRRQEGRFQRIYKNHKTFDKKGALLIDCFVYQL